MLHFARWNVVLIVAVCVAAVLFALPNGFDEDDLEGLPSWLPHQRINLGLDLRGGSHLLLEVGTDAVIQERLTTLVDDVRATLRRARLGWRDLGLAEGGVRFRLVDPSKAGEVRTLLAELGDDFALTSLDDGRMTLTLTEAAIAERRQHAVEQSIEIVRRRIDETGTREPTIQRQGDERIVVQLPGLDDPDRVKRLLGQTAKLTFHLVDLETSPADAQRGRLPASSMLLTGDDPSGQGEQLWVVRKRVMVSGDLLVDAQPSTDRNGQPAVSFRFDSNGARRFGDVTTQNVNRLLAIVLDGRVISAPRIQEPILGGSGIITGSTSIQEANDLALLLRAGALPAPLLVVEERTVGPDLGADSIRAGALASLLGLALVILFMGIYYGLFGLIADVALLLNIALIVALLSILQATLTLPGIAGIVLTMGMAVDANVLIFERVREELRSGRSPISALDAGYRRALTTIVDSNLTTLFATLLLFQFGSGPIKGFAVTLSIGILTSMFTAIMVTRLIIALWVRRRRPSALPI